MVCLAPLNQQGESCLCVAYATCLARDFQHLMGKNKTSHAFNHGCVRLHRPIIGPRKVENVGEAFAPASQREGEYTPLEIAHTTILTVPVALDVLQSIQLTNSSREPYLENQMPSRELGAHVCIRHIQSDSRSIRRTPFTPHLVVVCANHGKKSVSGPHTILWGED